MDFTMDSIGNFLSQTFTETSIIFTESWVDDNFLLLALALFIFELIRYAFKKKLSWNMLGDGATNLATLFFLLVTVFFVGLAYIGAFVYAFENFSLTQLPITGWTILGCLILADLAYYWEHRFLHSNGFAWGTHSVHHSSPYFNISVAYRFGPLDWLFPFFFYLPLILLGFNPFVKHLSSCSKRYCTLKPLDDFLALSKRCLIRLHTTESTMRPTNSILIKTMREY